MKTILIGKKVVKLFDSIDELPIVNYQKYNKCLLLDSGIGSDIEALGKHIAGISQLLGKGETEKATKELQNYYQSLLMIANEVSPKHLAFAALIHSIDGKTVEDLTDDALSDRLKELKAIKHSTVVKVLNWIKKKLDSELEVYFPEDFLANAKEKGRFDKIIRRTNLMLDEVINDTDHQAEIDEIDNYLFSLYNPQVFLGKESAEVKSDKQFETACMLISQETGMNAKKMKVLEFYNTLSNIQKQSEAKLKAYKKGTKK